MRKTCTDCAEPFEAKRASAKYCSEKCKKRAQRRPGGTSAAKVLALPAETTSEPAPGGSVVAATLAELETAGRLDTALGCAALALARRIDAGAAETGSAFASLVRQHGTTLALAVRDAETAADKVDELTERRRRKASGG